MAETVIRPYELRDRAAVRRICCETADAGNPVEGFFHDRELISDLVTRYYTDFEPQHSFVAVRDGRVIGYLNGGLDAYRALRVTVWRIMPAALMRGLGRGMFCRRETWRLLWSCLRTLWARGLRWSSASGTGAAPHLHINLLPEARGAQIGRLLIERFVERVSALGCRMVEISVRGDNTAALHFFKRLGFVELARRKLILPTPVGYRVTHAVTCAKQW